MEIDFSATWKRQHCVLWLEGARTAWRTKSCIWDAAVLDVGGTAALRARAALCSASLDEQAVNVGAAVTQAAATSNCRLDARWDATVRCSFMGRFAPTAPVPCHLGPPQSGWLRRAFPTYPADLADLAWKLFAGPI